MSQWLTPEWISKQFELTLCPVYTQFLNEKRYKELSGKWSDIPGYRHALEVWFEGEELESFLYDDWPTDRDYYGHSSAVEVRFEEFPGWLPLATLGQEEAQFLLVQVSEEAAPVAMWEHETNTLVPVAPSLSEFLNQLRDTLEAN